MALKNDRKKILKAVLARVIALYRETCHRRWAVCEQPYEDRIALYRKVLAKKGGSISDEAKMKKFLGVDRKGSIPLPLSEIASVLSELYQQVRWCDSQYKLRIRSAPVPTENVEELLAQVAGDVAAASHAEFWPDDKNALLLCSPAQNDRVNEEIFPRPGGLPLGVSYADLDRFNAIFSSIKGDIARGQGWTGGTSDYTPFFFTILSKNTYERMEERYGNTFGYYAPDHYYKKLVKYKVLIDSDKQGLPFCDFREFQSAPYGEMEVLSVFNGVWVDLPSFVESLLATWLDYWGDFGKMRLCKQCDEIFFSDRAGDERGFFCPKEFGTNCQQSYHASSDAVRCRERNCKRIGRKISQLEVWLDKRLFVDKLTTDICKGGRCPFDGKPPIESDCPYLLEANRKYLDIYGAEKVKRQETATDN